MDNIIKIISDERKKQRKRDIKTDREKETKKKR
jgi:hypothetical protein